MSQDKSEMDSKLKKMTVQQLKELAKESGLKIPKKIKKSELITLILNSNLFDNKQLKDKSDDSEENLEIEIIAGEEKKENIKRETKDLKFWQKPPFSSLLDPELAKDSNIAFYDLASLVDQFFDKMLQEDLINYKISGIALRTSAVLHHYKISSIIKEEEEIQKKEELKKFRERHYKTIPKALPQPIQPKLLLSTKEELFEAMRSAIIETMQKKEKLRRQRLKREELKRKRLQMRSKAQLPKELLKHITGKEQTIEELHELWYNRIKAKVEIENKRNTSLFELAEIIKAEEQDEIGRKFALVRLFLALMFLSTGNKLFLSQDDEFKNINIFLKSKLPG
ncbi:MAG: Rho termination factor N-terminal domain-containing protein [Promethearchaeota archaeon]